MGKLVNTEPHLWRDHKRSPIYWEVGGLHHLPNWHQIIMITFFLEGTRFRMRARQVRVISQTFSVDSSSLPQREREREDGLRVGLTMHASMCTYMIWFEKFWSVYQKLGHTTKRKPFSFKTVFSTIVLRLAAILLEHVNLPIAHPSSMWWIIVFNFGQRNQPTHNSLN